MMRIDLHSHSRASDGTDPPSQVVRHALEAELDVLALTDHDTVSGHQEAIDSAAGSGLTMVSGCELSSTDHGRSVHLLAYLFDPDEPRIAAELERLRGDRERRARCMVAYLRELGAEVTWERVRRLAAGDAVGRPHVAQAMVEAGVVPDLPSAFTREWLAEGGRAYEPKYAPDPVRAVQLVTDAGGVVVLAHPGVTERRGGGAGDAEGAFAGVGEEASSVPGDLIGRLADAGLHGLEIDHPEQGPRMRRTLRELAADLDLVVTGGSDDHGEPTGWRLGSELTAPEDYERLVSAASGASVVVG